MGLSVDELCSNIYSDIYNNIINTTFGDNYNLTSLSVGSRIYQSIYPCICNMNNGNYIVAPLGVILTPPEIINIVTVSDCHITQIYQCNGNTGVVTSGPNNSGSSGGSSGSGGSGGNGGNNPSSTCECTAVRTISGYEGTAFYTDCNGNPAEISVPGGTGIAGAACFCRQSGTAVTGAVIIEACQSSFGQGTINNICGSTVLCN
jgi:hypothetical protein